MYAEVPTNGHGAYKQLPRDDSELHASQEFVDKPTEPRLCRCCPCDA